MIGRTIGNYVVREKIGEGGMGVVYRAEHPHIKRHVAIKVLHPGADRNPEVVHRFFNEARAATEIRNAHIVEVMDFGELPEGTPYLVMEWLEGESLGSLLRATRKLPVPRAAHILGGIARALKAAHSKGVVHRDLKPDNVFLVRVEGEPDLIKVLDFGIAKLLVTGMPARYQTQTGAIIGTPAYMSPEQCRGAKEIDHRSDVYSLGVMGYQMLTGRLPFDAEALGELLLKHMTEKPPPPAAIEPSVPEAISGVIAGALEKEPDKRPTVDQIVAIMEGGSPSALFFTTGRAGGTVPMPTSEIGAGEAGGLVAGAGSSAGAAAGSKAIRAPAGAHTTLGASASELGLGGVGRASARRRVRVIAVGVGIVAVAAVALFVMRRPPSRASAPPVAAAPSAAAPAGPAPPAPAPTPASAAAPAPAAVPGPAAEDPRSPAGSAVPGAVPAALVGIALRTEPETARLEIDGQPVSNPYAKALARDLGSHTIRASLPGFVTATEVVTFDRDRELVLRLGRAPETAAAANRPAPNPKPRGATRPRADERLTTPSEKDSIRGKAPGYRGSKLNIETEFPGAN